MVNPETLKIPTELLQSISTEQAWHYKVVPKAESDQYLELWVDAGEEHSPIEQDLAVLTNKLIKLVPIDPKAIAKALNTYYRVDKQERVASKLISPNADVFVSLISEAKLLESSDIHIEPYETRSRVRMRVDGMLVERHVISKKDYPGLVNKIKIKAHLDIAEKRLPQDGRIYFEDGNNKFDIRVSILPTLYGEKVVMRLLRNDASNIDIANIGLTDTDLSRYVEGVKRPNGIILVSGPTGSGKTTTLYATLKMLNADSRNIMTVEDPIEYTLNGINQVQVKEDIGLTFAKALRSFLRQDPDVIMVGEIRDAETAGIAIRSALTGHLVLSTIHTNSAWGTISRLIDMGVQPFLLASTLNTTIAQRLVRLLCDHCKREQKIDDAIFPSGFSVNNRPKTLYEPVGCEHCYYAGYKGRKAIFEVIPIDNETSELIKKNELSIEPILQKNSISTLKEQAFTLLAQGETSLEEVYALLSN